MPAAPLWDSKLATYTDPLTGANLGSKHTYLMSQAATAAKDWQKKQDAAQLAALDVTAAEDAAEENRTRTAGMTSLAHRMAGGAGGFDGSGNRIGRGLFQRRLASTRPSAVGALSTANAASLAAKRKAALLASQQADPFRGNPLAGYLVAQQRALAGAAS